MKKLLVILLFSLPVTATALARTTISPATMAADATADDTAIWTNPDDETVSRLIVVANSELNVFDMDGAPLQSLIAGRVDSIDLRYNVQMGERNITVLAASNGTEFVTIYEITDSGELAKMGEVRFGIPANGLCMYQSATMDNMTSIIITNSEGDFEQREITVDENGRLEAIALRRYTVGESLDGCVADDELGTLYVNEPGVTIWKYCADSEHDEMLDIEFAEKYGMDYDAELERNSVIALDADAPLISDLTLYRSEGVMGYLAASVAETGDIMVFDRGAANDELGTVTLEGFDGLSGVAASANVLAAAGNGGAAVFNWADVSSVVGAPLEAARSN
ncbi:MAG: phytase [Chloroflexota bacterium]